ncbi:alpha/beta fold hydrolase [Streptomyces shenzhenensis]|uniref:alpha/beta fold hydrolase n=1 Tax=Streptomyces shenzhenensis TaxID=943815 RepID=UPI0036A07248
MGTGNPREQVEELDYKGLAFSYRMVECEAPVTEPFVVLSGAYQDKFSYRRFDKYWQDTATIVCVDLPGSRTADPVPAEGGYDIQTEALAHLIDELGLSRVNLLGISNGFPAAYRYAQQSPSRVSRLALAGAADWPPRNRERMTQLYPVLAAGRFPEFAEGALDLLMCLDPAVTVRNREIVHRALNSRFSTVEEADLPGYLNVSHLLLQDGVVLPGGISGVPSLCLVGEHDTFATMEGARALAAEIEGALFAVIPEADHLVFLGRAAEWAETIARFFTDRPLEELDFLSSLETLGRPAADRGSSSISLEGSLHV